jgi:hypothetical protein
MISFDDHGAKNNDKLITRMVEIKENVVMNFVSIDSYYLHSMKKTI